MHKSSPESRQAEPLQISTLIKIVLAVSVLANALTFDIAWPGFGVLPQPDVSIEALLLAAAAIVLLANAPPPHAQRRRLTLLAGLFTLLVVLHYVNVSVSAHFGRAFNLYWDGRHVPQVLVMAATNSSPALVLAASCAVLAALASLYWLCRWVLRTVSNGATSVGHGRVIAALLAGLAAVAGAVGLWAPTPYRDHIVTPLSATYGKQLLLAAAVFAPGMTDRLLAPSPPFRGNLAALNGADVMLMFSESYGVSTFEDPQLANALAPARQELDAALAASKRRTASAFVVSPTFGGGSWLAHAALLSGVDMRQADHHSLLLSSQRSTLVKHLKANGYRSVALMPGLRADWPEGSFYGFDQLYDARALDYTGPEFGFWKIPDQYSVSRLHALELQRPKSAPRLVVFPTITSHLPFDPLPPLARDWAFAHSEPMNQAFNQSLDTSAVRTALSLEPNWAALREPYIRSMDYALRWQAGYLRELAAPDLLLIVVGDHQPAATVVGRGADWLVPIHVISQSAELIERFVRAGFTPGMVPQRPALGQMHELTPTLLEIFSGCGANPKQSVLSGCDPARVDIARPRAGG